MPHEVVVSTNNIEAHKAFGVSSSGVRVLDVYGFVIDGLCLNSFSTSLYSSYCE
jgi:hypothetical protein